VQVAGQTKDGGKKESRAQRGARQLRFRARSAQWRNIDLLACLDAVRVVDAVCLGDLAIFIGIAVKVFADL
jgi:hypothetical protein